MAIDWAALTAPVTRIFGEEVLYRPATGGEYPITGVFDAAFKEVLGLKPDGSPMTSVAPTLGMQPRDLPAMPLKGDHLTVLSTGFIYRVREVRPDSHGGAILMLNEVS
jgi:hypothetical protein